MFLLGHRYRTPDPRRSRRKPSQSQTPPPFHRAVSPPSRCKLDHVMFRLRVLDAWVLSKQPTKTTAHAGSRPQSWPPATSSLYIPPTYQAGLSPLPSRPQPRRRPSREARLAGRLSKTPKKRWKPGRS
ncbi:hypothetical protein LX32DRAFT_53814 [Colletotrichum zoysiae]|uniref:Uncharacterized protein n=1 Tax=Colletotrichum zoysiae TaxID=1216348 RepID=A0AAD9LX30_9PEZI|nr:hypothetical protein LX32DRAFT_53814 [Colletotrichum zoysiae]